MFDNLNEKQIVSLVESRWKSSKTIWELIRTTYELNTKMYDCDVRRDQMPEYIRKIPARKPKLRANRIFTNVEAVINAVIANPPRLNVIPTRSTAEAVELARLQEQYFIKKYDDRNVKEKIRVGLRNLFFARLIILKPFWNNSLNDFDVKPIDPRKVRFSSTSTCEDNSDFAIELVEDSILSVIDRFPEKKEIILEKCGETAESAMIENKQIAYKEAWIGDKLICVFQGELLYKGDNPYWDKDGLIVTHEENASLLAVSDPKDNQISRKELLAAIREDQQNRLPSEEDATLSDLYTRYYFNYFDKPRKPYVFATMLNNEACPIGRTDFITQAAPLQEAVDRRKRQIDDNAEMMNGITKVDSSVMTLEEAQKLRYETTGIIWGPGVASGVQRETGVSLPAFIFEDMVDSRNEIDNIMAATAAFRGEREGRETKAGRLALIEQSFLRLNELVQVVDYVSYELFGWFYQLAKTRYTERHYAKFMGHDNSMKVLELMQDDFEDGSEIKIIPGKTLPEDSRFKYDRAQNDVMNGIISPIDYLKDAGYDSPMTVAQNAVKFKANPMEAVGLNSISPLPQQISPDGQPLSPHPINTNELPNPYLPQA